MGCSSSKSAGGALPGGADVAGSVSMVSNSTGASGSMQAANSKPSLVKFEQTYKLGRELGHGSFSTVREATNKTNNEKYAVKCIKRADLPAEDEDALKMEVQILREIKHPNVVKLFDFFQEKSFYYLVMEVMKGGELFDRIVLKQFYSEKEARDVLKVVLSAIDYCHERNIVHRDLKPENLLLVSDRDDSALKLADFGFARTVDGAGLRTQCGTPGYVAPEILKGEAYGKEVDMWSIGVITYILLGGYPPFHDENQAKLYQKIKKGRVVFHPPYWDQVSDEAKDLIRKMLTLDSKLRITAAQALKHPWITQQAEVLAARDLGPNLQQLKLFNARRKFKSAIQSVIIAQKLKTLADELGMATDETAPAEPVQA